MRTKAWFLIGLSVFLPGQVRASIDCDVTKKPQPMNSSALQLAPIAAELNATSAQVGAGVGFSQLIDNNVTVDLVLSRMRQDQCVSVAAPSTTVQPGDSGAYKPKTAYDNTPWRFDMTQNGKRMTADEFDAWMKAKGVRVVKGPATTASAAPPPPAAEPVKPAKKKKKP